MSEVKRIYIRPDEGTESHGVKFFEACDEDIGHRTEYRISTDFAELEAENRRLLGQPGRQHTISYLEDLKAENKRLREALVVSVVPYEALLADNPSRKWVAPEIWETMQKAVTLIRAALEDTHE